MKKILVLISFLSLFSILPQTVLALGQVTQPINITNALRGEKIHQELIAVNSENKIIAIEFTAGGQIKDWVRFYRPNDLKNPISTTTMNANANLTMTAVFSIPADAPNGEYNGVVSVTKAPDQTLQKDQNQTSIAQKIDRSVNIKISDTENIKLVASVIPKTFDLKPGEPLSVRIIYDNQSNISLRPSINFKVKKDDKTVYNVIYPYPEEEADVNPKAIHEIPAIEIPMVNLASGEYLAQLEFLRGDKTILKNNFGFSIYAQNEVFVTKAINFFKKDLNWLLWLLVIILLAVFAYLVKKNADIRRRIKKTRIVKTLKESFKFAWGSIVGLF